MDESRKAFESWLASTTNSDLHRGVMLDRRESGRYSHLSTENKWEEWQASRAAIEIELPEADLVYSSATDSYGVEGCMMLPESLVERVLLDAGIKVKE